jgi:hypothetical protein
MSRNRRLLCVFMGMLTLITSITINELVTAQTPPCVNASGGTAPPTHQIDMECGFFTTCSFSLDFCYVQATPCDNAPHGSYQHTIVVWQIGQCYSWTHRGCESCPTGYQWQCRKYEACVYRNETGVCDFCCQTPEYQYMNGCTT